MTAARQIRPTGEVVGSLEPAPRRGFVDGLAGEVRERRRRFTPDAFWQGIATFLRKAIVEPDAVAMASLTR